MAHCRSPELDLSTRVLLALVTVKPSPAKMAPCLVLIGTSRRRAN